MVALANDNLVVDLVFFVPLIVRLICGLMPFELLAMVGSVVLSVDAMQTPISVSSWNAGPSLKPPATSSPTPPSS